MEPGPVGLRWPFYRCFLLHIWKRRRFRVAALMKNSDFSRPIPLTNAPDFQTVTFISSRDRVSISLTDS